MATPTPPKPRGRGKWVVALMVMVVVGYLIIGKRNTTQLACDTAFDAGTRAVAVGNLGAARIEAVRASAACTGDMRSQADALQAAIAAAQSANNTCLHRVHSIDSQIDERRLNGARTSLNQLSAECSAKEGAAQVRARLSQSQEAAQAALDKLRAALDARDAPQSKTALARLTAIYRDDPDLNQWREDVDRLVAADAAAQVAADKAAAAAQASRAEETSPIAPRAPARQLEIIRESQRSSMAAAFMRDAELALSQRKFDAARTYVESARRVDPANARLDSLSQLIRERERQVLQQETTIR